MKLVDNSKLGEQISLLNRSEGVIDYERLRVIGWGRNSQESTLTASLQYLDLPAIPNNVCKEQYGTFGKNISSSTLCAGFSAGELDFCVGTSGSGAVVMRNGIPKLSGLVSWGLGCGSSGRGFGVYTRISSIVEWIEDTLDSEI